MKLKRKDGTIDEVEAGTVPAEGEEIVKEEEVDKGLEKMFDQRVKDIIQAIKDTPARTIPAGNANLVLERSVMETDLLRRKARPFVQLSKTMEDFVSNVKTVARGGVVKTLNEADDTAGGFLVPEEFQAEVIRYASESALVRGRARVFNMTRDSFSIPKLDQSSDQFAGADVYWEGESDLKTPSQPTFGKVKLVAKKLIGLCPVTDELLADSAINIANFLVAFFGEIINYKEDYAFLRGNGMAKPLGIIDGAGIIVNRTTASKILIADVEAMWEQLPAWATPGAVWITTKAGYAQFLQFRADAVSAGDKAGALLFVPSLAGGNPATVLDIPVLITDKLPAVGAKGDIILCNLAYYYIGDRGSLEVASSIHDRFRYDETTFRFVKRVDGQPAIDKAFVVLDVPEES